MNPDHLMIAKTGCPSLDALLDCCREDSQAESFVSTHLEACDRCNEVLTLALAEGDHVVALMRRGNPLRAYESEPELHSLLALAPRPVDEVAATRTFATDSLATRPASLPTGIEGYTILGELASGGMGIVYRAHQTALDRDVALKMVLPHTTSPQLLRRFYTESNAVARLQHPHIIEILELGVHDGRPFFSMELLEGGNLQERLRRQRMTPEEAAELTAVIADAVHYSHAKGVLHRDLKPSNVLFTAAGVPKISDFGLAKHLVNDTDRELTRDETVLGTPSYMAPEQARGAISEIQPATDVYGVGAILYRILTGRAPFAGANELEILDNVRHRLPVPPSQHNPQVCPDLEAICLKCLAKLPQHRYGAADQLAADLRRWRAGEMPRACREKRYQRIKVAAAAAVALGLLFVAAMLIRVV